MSSETTDEPKPPPNSPASVTTEPDASTDSQLAKVKEILAEKTGQYDLQSKTLETLQGQHQTLNRSYHQDLGKLNEQITQLHARVAEDDHHISNLLSQLQGQQRYIDGLEANKVWCPWNWIQKVAQRPYLTGAFGVVCLAGGVKLWRLKC